MILLYTLFGIIGAIFVSKGKPINANWCFVFANIGLAVHNFTIKEYEMMFLFFIYLNIAIYGLLTLNEKE